MSYSKCANDTDCSKEHGGIHSDDISEYWEAVASHGLGLPWKRWHIAFLVVSGIMSFVILVCCCIKFRIPRTKQEIEADYVRRKILRKFKERLKAIQNQELDEMDLKKALDKIRSEFKSDSESIAQSEAGFSAATLSSAGVAGAHGSTYRRASQIQIDISLEELRAHTLGMKARFILALNRLFGRSKVSQSDKVALTLDINAEGDTQLNVTESAVKANNAKKDTEVKKVGKADDKKKELPVKEDNKVKPESSKDKMKGKGKDEKKGKPTKSDPEQPGSSGVVAGSSKTPGKGAPPPATVKVENEKPKKGKAKGDKGKGKDEPGKAKENDKAKPEKAKDKSETPKDKSVKPKDKAEKPNDKPEKSKPPADKDEKAKQKAEKEKEEKEKLKLEKEKQKQEKEKQKAEKEKQKLEKEKEKVAKAKEKADQIQQKKLEEQKKKEEKVKSKPDKPKEKDSKGKDGNKGP